MLSDSLRLQCAMAYTWGFLWNSAVRKSSHGIPAMYKPCFFTNAVNSGSCHPFAPFGHSKAMWPPWHSTLSAVSKTCFNNFLDNRCFFFKRSANSLPYLATFTACHFGQGSQGNEPHNVAPGNWSIIFCNDSYSSGSEESLDSLVSLKCIIPFSSWTFPNDDSGEQQNSNITWWPVLAFLLASEWFCGSTEDNIATTGSLTFLGKPSNIENAASSPFSNSFLSFFALATAAWTVARFWVNFSFWVKPCFAYPTFGWDSLIRVGLPIIWILRSFSPTFPFSDPFWRNLFCTKRTIIAHRSKKSFSGLDVDFTPGPFPPIRLPKIIGRFHWSFRGWLGFWLDGSSWDFWNIIGFHLFQYGIQFSETCFFLSFNSFSHFWTHFGCSLLPRLSRFLLQAMNLSWHASECLTSSAMRPRPLHPTVLPNLMALSQVT